MKIQASIHTTATRYLAHTAPPVCRDYAMSRGASFENESHTAQHPTNLCREKKAYIRTYMCNRIYSMYKHRHGLKTRHAKTSYIHIAVYGCKFLLLPLSQTRGGPLIIMHFSIGTMSCVCTVCVYYVIVQFVYTH